MTLSCECSIRIAPPPGISTSREVGIGTVFSHSSATTPMILVVLSRAAATVAIRPTATTASAPRGGRVSGSDPKGDLTNGHPTYAPDRIRTCGLSPPEGERSIQLSYGRSGMQLTRPPDRAESNICSSDGVNSIADAERGAKAMRQRRQSSMRRASRGFRSSSHSGRDIHMTWSSISGRAGFLRVQCKTARRSEAALPSTAIAPITDGSHGPMTAWPTCSAFTSEPTRRIYVVPIDKVAATQVRLRLKPTRNNQH